MHRSGLFFCYTALLRPSSHIASVYWSRPRSRRLLQLRPLKLSSSLYVPCDDLGHRADEVCQLYLAGYLLILTYSQVSDADRDMTVLRE
jgi:hypothetical protein